MVFTEMCSRGCTVQPAHQKILEFHISVVQLDAVELRLLQHVWSESKEDRLSLKSSEVISKISLPAYNSSSFLIRIFGS